MISPLDKPWCFWGKQWLVCLNNNNKKKLLNVEESEVSKDKNRDKTLCKIFPF